MNNLVLIGMPGAGKSTIGVVLAKTLGMSFIDTDLLIQQNTKMLLQNIIINRGLDEFLSIESDVISNLNASNSVIATGGSVISSADSISHLKENGILIYLQLRYEEIESRIKNISTRGIARNEDQTLLDIYNERIPLYEKYSDIVINCTNRDVEEIISTIISNNIYK